MDKALNLDDLYTLVGIATPETKDEVNRVIRRCQIMLGEAGWDKMPEPTIVFDLKGTTAGQAWGTNKIRLNLELLMDSRYHDDMLNRTVPHEYAHCVVADRWPKAKPHGLEWELVMQVLGLPADRCHQYDAKPARVTSKFNYSCLCARGCTVGAAIHRRVQEQGRSYRCSKCKTYLYTCEYRRVR